jgi:hypothetical protein
LGSGNKDSLSRVDFDCLSHVNDVMKIKKVMESYGEREREKVKRKEAGKQG